MPYHTKIIAYNVVTIAIIILLTPSIMGEYAHFHINFKENDLLLPESKGDINAAPEEIYVQAQYDEVGGLRINKQWVQIGKWESSYREMDFNFSIEQFNFWFKIVQEQNQDADPEYRFDFNLNGDLIFNGNSDSFDPGDEGIREHIWYMEQDAIFSKSNDFIEIFFNYSGYEDLIIYIDNATYDTGIQGETNIFYTISSIAKNNEISLELYDIFNSNWHQVKSYIDIDINDESPTFVSIKIEKKFNVNLNNISINSTIITWRLNTTINEGDEINIWMKYTIASSTEDKGIVVTTIGKSSDNGTEGNYNIPAFAIIITLAVIGSTSMYKKRMKA